MHELSIAMRIVETLTEALADTPGRVNAVRIRVGALSGVVPHALQFVWQAACEGTRLDGSALEIEEVPARVHCPQCDADRALPALQQLRCPACGAVTPEIVGGRELDIASVEVADDAEADRDSQTDSQEK